MPNLESTIPLPNLGTCLELERNVGLAIYEVIQVNLNLVTTKLISSSFNDGLPIGHLQTHPWDIYLINGVKIMDT